MTSLKQHLAALILLAIAGGFFGALAAVGVIPGHTAEVAFLAVLIGVGTVIGVKIGATAATPTVTPAPAPKPVPAPAPVVPIQQVAPPAQP